MITESTKPAAAAASAAAAAQQININNGMTLYLSLRLPNQPHVRQPVANVLESQTVGSVKARLEETLRRPYIEIGMCIV